jgi:large-conductance mechanosensitive channel
MSTFNSYLVLGFQHIMNIQALDHLLFILSIACVYRFYDLKKLFFLITAFTLGHSLTLALATLHWINFSQNWIEFLIPCTILFSAISNLNFKETKIKSVKLPRYKFIIVSLFGLIHGLGFSNYLQSLLGQESSIITPLLAFNVGLELAQIIIVLSILFMSSMLIDLFKIKLSYFVLVVSGIIIGLSLPMIFERW